MDFEKNFSIIFTESPSEKIVVYLLKTMNWLVLNHIGIYILIF